MELTLLHPLNIDLIFRRTARQFGNAIVKLAVFLAELEKVFLHGIVIGHRILSLPKPIPEASRTID